jgi:hypothetical protein
MMVNGLLKEKYVCMSGNAESEGYRAEVCILESVQEAWAIDLKWFGLGWLPPR